MLFLEFIVEVLGEAFDIEGALEALGDIGDGGAAFFVEVGDVHHERGELGEKEVSRLALEEEMVAGVDLPFLSPLAQYQRLWLRSALRKIRRFSWWTLATSRQAVRRVMESGISPPAASLLEIRSARKALTTWPAMPEIWRPATGL